MKKIEKIASAKSIDARNEKKNKGLIVCKLKIQVHIKRKETVSLFRLKSDF